jgi:Domain of unknown function (DUF4259)
MGAWGVGIFSNDSAADIRDDLRDLIAEGVSAEAATSRLREEYGIGDGGPDDHDFWLGLAAAQHSIGHVDENVRSRAMDIIDAPEELQRWQPKDRRRRQAALQKLRERLGQSPPKPKRLRPRTKVDTRLEEGQHVLVDVGGRRVLLRVTGVTHDKGGRYPHAVVLAWNGSDRQLRKAHRLPAVLDPTPLREDEALGFLLIGEPHDPESLVVLPQVTDRRTPRRRWASRVVTKWSGLGRHLAQE